MKPATFSFPTAALLTIAVVVIHVLANILTPYGLHRDEFLYLAMGEHLRLWRMDFPPFIAVIACFSRLIFGESLPGIRLAPALAHAGLVYATTFVTALYGGRRSAQMLAGLGILLCPTFLRAGGMLQPVVFDQLWWTLVLLGLMIRIRDNDPKHWAGTGLFLGLAALTKFSVAFLSAGIVAALLFTSLRRDLRTRWPWIAIIIATVVGHPSITGQVSLGWPVRSQFADLQTQQLSHVSALSFLTGQFSTGPLLFLAVGGMIWLFTSYRATDTAPSFVADMGEFRETKVPGGLKSDLNTPGALKSEIGVTGALQNGSPDYRPIAVITATAFLILLVMRGKAYYIAPIYPILTAAGAAALDQFSTRLAPSRPTKVLAAAAAVVAIYGMLTLPFGLPLLAPPDMSRVSELLGKQNKSNTGEALPLPQDYADMLGWRELTRITARVWRALPAADTANAILIGTNYGRAGALDFYGRDMGLPPAISPAGSYWFFGPGTKNGETAIVVSSDAASLETFYKSCVSQAHTNNPWGVPEEQSVQVYVCRGARATIQDAWPGLAGRN